MGILDDIKFKHIKNYFACKHYRVLECVYDFNFGGNYICVMEDV